MATYVSLTPWAREALEPDELAGLHARAAALGAYLSVTGRGHNGPWTIYASTGSLVAGAQLVPGSLITACNAVLDDFRSQKVQMEAELSALLEGSALVEPRYTPDELVTIAVQSGIEVERA